MQKKTIAFVTYNLNSGGAERVLTTLANALCDKYSVVIITISDGASFYTLDNRIKTFCCGLSTNQDATIISRTFDYWKTIRTLKSLYKENKIDLAISFLTTVNIFSLLAAKWCRIPSIISERNNPIVNPPTLFWRMLRNITYKFSDLLIVQTRNNADFYKQIMPNENIKIVPNPLAVHLTGKRVIKNIKKEKRIILNVGRLDENKSQDLLIRAFANVPNDQWNIQFVGEGAMRDSYIDLAKEMGIIDKVAFLGNQRNIWDFYNSANIFVFTSKSEGFPNALIEALYFGLPTISTDCPHGPSEIIQNGINGYLIEVGDQKSLEQKLISLMNDSDLQEKFREESIKVASKYAAPDILNIWESLIIEIIAKD